MLALLGAVALSSMGTCAKTLDGDDGDGDGDAGGGSSGCDSFEDRQGDTIVIAWVNQRTQPIFVWGPSDVCNAGRPDFAIAEDGSDLAIDPPGCGQTCSQYQDALPSDCGGACLAEPLVRIESGFSYEFEWRSGEYRPVEMDSSCAADDTGYQGVCFQKKPLAEGTYEVRGAYFIYNQCRDPSASGDQECVCGSSVCEMPEGFEITGSSEVATVTVDLPSAGVVKLTAM